jgi:hypothetical protein
MSAVRQATLRLSPSASLGASAKQGKLSRKARSGAPPVIPVNVQRQTRVILRTLMWPTRHAKAEYAKLQQLDS